MGENDVFKKCHIIALGSQQTTENNEFLLKHVIAMRWTHQIAFVSSTMPWRIYSEDY